jgi:type I restriction enzyme S subunit
MPATKSKSKAPQLEKGGVAADGYRMSKLPKGWSIATVGELAESIQYGHTASSTKEKIGPRFLRITDIQDNRVDWSAVPYCKIPDAQIPKYQLAKGDLLFARTGATVGKSFLIQTEIPESIFASYLIRVRVTKAIEPRYLYYFFQTPDYWLQISDNASGIGQPNVNGTKLASIVIPIAPLPEQRRIVARIEELFSHLAAGVAALRHAKAQLQRYRQSVLAAAVTGELTKEWRERHPESGCSKVYLGDLCKFSQGVQVPKEDQAEVCGDGMVRFLRIVDYTKGDEPPRYIVAPGKQYIVQKTDLAMIRYGSAGKICWGYEGVIANNLFRIEPDARALKPYLFHYFSSPQFLQVLAFNIKGATMPAISFKFLKELQIKLPSIIEQHQIVAEVEARTTAIDHLEAELDRQITRSNRLRQSILNSAFNGSISGTSS